MSFLKRFQDSVHAQSDFIREHPAVTSLIGPAFLSSPLLDKIIEHETKPYVHEGEQAGYARASDVYEKKLLEQADQFLAQSQSFERERDAYEVLLDEYEAEIQKLTNKVNRTEAENEYLQNLLLRERQLLKIAH